MKFWDASALVPLLVKEPASKELQAIAASDPEMLVWWGTEIECTSAIARLLRTDCLDAPAFAAASQNLKQLTHIWDEVEPSEFVRTHARRFLRVHALRAAGALQLAAAFVGANSRPETLELLTLDDRLVEAASKEGFVVLPSAE